MENKSEVSFYDAGASVFDEISNYRNYEQIASWVFDVFHARSPVGCFDSAALDVCSGTGKLSHLLMKKGVGKCEALELSHEMVKFCEKHYPDVRVFEGDMNQYSYGFLKYELITCMWNSILQVPDGRALYELLYKLYGALRKGGVFVSEIVSKDIVGAFGTSFGDYSLWYSWKSSRNTPDFLNLEMKVSVRGEEITSTSSNILALSLAEYEMLLREVGFSEVDFFKADFKEISHLEGKKNRALVVARKD